MKSRNKSRVGFIIVEMVMVALCSLGQAAESVPLGWDPSPDPNVAGYALYYGTASGVYTTRLDAGTNTLLEVAGLQEGQTYYFVVTAYDAVGNESAPSGELALTVPVVSPPQPPTLDPLPALVIDENAGPQTIGLSEITPGPTAQVTNLTVSAVSRNPALIPAPVVTYTSPGMTGSLSFTPTANSFGGAALSVIVDNGQTISNTIRRVLYVTVNPTMGQLSIGATVLQAGQNGSVPLTLSSSAGLTNVSAVLELPSGYLTNLALEALVPEVDPDSAMITAQPDGSWLLQLAAEEGEALVGSNVVAQLDFTAIPGQQSGFVPLGLLPFTAWTADGTLLTNRPANGGRVVVVGSQSLLEPRLDASGNPSLLLYGSPSSSYIVEFTTNLASPLAWLPLWSNISPATLMAPVPLLSPSPDIIFYRAVEVPTPAN
jgi:hypothetical protein